MLTTRGAVSDCTNTRGQHFKFEYDHSGRLRSIIKGDGKRFNIERDEKGRIKRVAPESVAQVGMSYRLLSHILSIQVDIDDPNIDWDDPLVIYVWAQYWTEYPMSGGLSRR